MNCSSLPDNQTADFIERFFPFTYNQILDNDSGCYDFVNHEYVIWHRSLAELRRSWNANCQRVRF